MASPARWWLWSTLVHMGLAGVAWLFWPWSPEDAHKASVLSSEVASTDAARAQETPPQLRDLQRRLRDIRRVERALGALDQAPMAEGEKAEDMPALETEIRATAARIEKLNEVQKEQVWARIEQAHAKAQGDPVLVVPTPPPHAAPPIQPAQSLEQLQQQADQILARSRAQEQAQTQGVTLSTAQQEAVQASPRTGWGNQDRRAYGHSMSTPQVRHVSRLTGAQTLGSAGAWASRVQVDAWYVIGPFGGMGPHMITLPFPVEAAMLKGPDLDQVFIGKHGTPLSWKRQKLTGYPMVPLGVEEYAVFYGYTDIWSEVAQDVVLDLGADDDARVWLNGQEIWASGSGFKPWYTGHFSRLTTEIAQMNLTESKVKVHLRAGQNQLAFKLYNGYSASFISVVFTAETS